MKRGEIYYVQNNWQEVGSEQRAGRPAVIVSNNSNNYNSEVVEVVYMTTKPKNDLPTHVVTRSTPQDSTILCEQIFSVSKQRLGEYVGKLTESEMQALDIALAISLGLDFGALPVMKEPIEEDLEEPQEAAIAAPIQSDDIETFVKLTELCKERDLYKKFSEDLVEILKGGARS